MNDGNGQQSGPVVPFDPTIVPQGIMIGKDENGMVHMLIVQAMVSHDVAFDRDGALKIADQLREAAGGLQVVTDAEAILRSVPPTP